VDFTSGMEADLDRIEEGELEWRGVLSDFYGPFRRQLEHGESRGEDIIRETVAADAGDCPVCGRPMAVRWNRYGRFLGCTGYPECRHTQPIDQKEKAQPRKIGAACPECSSDLVEREGRFGPFIACSNYPECKYTRPKTIPGMKCPQCGLGDVGEKRTRRSKPFWGCTRYPECDWSTWDEPVASACPSCKAPFIVRKSTKARGDFLKCLSCRSEYTQDAAGELEAAGSGMPTPAGRRAGKTAKKTGRTRKTAKSGTSKRSRSDD